MKQRKKKNTVGSSHHAPAFPWCTSHSGCASLTMPWWCKSHQRWRPVCLLGPLLAPATTAPLSAAKLPNKEASVRADPSHRLTEYTSSFSLLNQCILHHLAMRRMRASAGDGGVAFCEATCQIATHTVVFFESSRQQLQKLMLWGKETNSEKKREVCTGVHDAAFSSGGSAKSAFWVFSQSA